MLPRPYARLARMPEILVLYYSRGGSVARLARQIARNPFLLVRLILVRKWSERTVIALVMQSTNNSLTTFVRKRGPFKYVTSKQGHGEPNPTWIGTIEPTANSARTSLCRRKRNLPRANAAAAASSRPSGTLTNAISRLLPPVTQRLPEGSVWSAVIRCRASLV